jgi:hypothetical protein
MEPWVGFISRGVQIARGMAGVVRATLQSRCRPAPSYPSRPWRVDRARARSARADTVVEHGQVVAPTHRRVEMKVRRELAAAGQPELAAVAVEREPRLANALPVPGRVAVMHDARRPSRLLGVVLGAPRAACWPAALEARTQAPGHRPTRWDGVMRL